MFKYISAFALAAGWLAITPALAQSSGNSPYSRLGIGEVSTNNGNIRNFSMGGTGVSSPNSAQVNELNPALLYYNNNVIFEMSVASQLKTLKEENRSQRDGNTTLNTISLSLPVHKRWTAAVGLKPFSTVQYETNTSQPVTGDPNTQALVRYSGDGGLTEVYFGNGVKVAKDLTVGVAASYIFGTINNNFTSAIQNQSGQQLQVSQQTTYNDFAFKSGLAYRRKFGEKYSIGIGGVYNFPISLTAERRTQLERMSFTSVTSSFQADSTSGKAQIPGGFQAGISIDNGTNWSVALDVASQAWGEFKSFEGRNELKNALRVGLGGEYVPEPASPRYFRRVAYRAGLSFGQTPYQLAGKQVNEAAVTWGFTLPVGRALITESNFLNLGFAYGKRGTTDDNLVQENFIRVQAGFTLNNKWFIQRKLD
ncbi:hypothetical protein [Adhaeribacter soli]|uniref:Aromatic hydrocarbon degradation protein n=1 Tax=Adhaeribacter soli TaxID=2607655 RepID=A0A5N1J5V2_9BACT|nr:hypothetical protein [Adhaeribacter soli]KAA9339973.1 hypothetical protein F0P94_06370 [Adhaeribacter soli]